MNQKKSNPTADPQPTITIDVDLRNPGQFFACCGLLELAHRLWGCKAQGCFSSSHFHLYTPVQANELKPRLIDKLKIKAKEYSEKAIAPLSVNGIVAANQAPEAIKPNGLLLNWWFASPAFKTWAGQQSSFSVISKLHKEALNVTDIVSGFQYTAGMTGRLSVDVRSSWTGLDVGFSPDKQGMDVATYPMVEFLSAIGLQRFQPAVIRSSNYQNVRYQYTVWHDRLSVSLGCVALYVMPSSRVERYTFRIHKRGNYKYFDKSIPGE